MPQINWSELPVFECKSTDLIGPWLTVAETIHDATRVRIKSEGSWLALGAFLQPCGPDGYTGLKVQSDQLVLPDCPLAALIGKIGGSSAELTGSVTQQPGPVASWVPAAAPAAAAIAPAAPAPAPLPAAPSSPAVLSSVEGKAFAIGSLCILTIPSGVIGPIFAGFNCFLRPVRVEKLKVSISIATPTQ
jgi:hypothetical protein